MEDGVFNFAAPYEIALQAHRFEWILRFERLSLLFGRYPRVQGLMIIESLGAERKMLSEPAGWAEISMSKVDEIGRQRLLGPAPFTASMEDLDRLPDALENHAVQLMEEPWRVNNFVVGNFGAEELGFKARMSHSLGVVSPTSGCYAIQITSFLSPYFDPLEASVGGRVNVAECAAFAEKLRAAVKACRAALFRQLFPSKRLFDIDKEQEEKLRNTMRKTLEKYGKPMPELWSPNRIWLGARFGHRFNDYLQWKESIVRSEMGEEAEVVSPPSYLDDAEFLGGGALPQVELEPNPQKKKGGDHGD